MRRSILTLIFPVAILLFFVIDSDVALLAGICYAIFLAIRKISKKQITVFKIKDK